MLLYQILASAIHEMVNWIITLGGKFELPYESYSASAVQHYSQYIIKKHKTLTNNPPARIYVNKVDNRITFKIKAQGIILSVLHLNTEITLKH